MTDVVFIKQNRDLNRAQSLKTVSFLAFFLVLIMILGYTIYCVFMALEYTMLSGGV